jgi:hypothetical protein
MRRKVLNALALAVVVGGGAALATPAEATLAGGWYCCTDGGKLACCGRTAFCFPDGSFCTRENES